jgi:hypothetical protein
MGGCKDNEAIKVAKGKDAMPKKCAAVCKKLKECAGFIYYGEKKKNFCLFRKASCKHCGTVKGMKKDKLHYYEKGKILTYRMWINIHCGICILNRFTAVRLIYGLKPFYLLQIITPIGF